jgi:competence ComEA-like helix-hairpin-helix protein
MPNDAPGPSWFPIRVQPLLAAAVASCLAAMGGWFVAAGGLRGGLVSDDRPPPPTARFTVNVNSAPAAELALLPGLGPALAGRIVEHRRVHGGFTDLEALTAVPGIGPATLDAIRPHLRPIRRRDPQRPMVKIHPAEQP